MEPDPIIKVRDRAYELADTGDYGVWPDISEVLTSEGYDGVCIRRLNGDHFFKSCCAIACGLLGTSATHKPAI